MISIRNLTKSFGDFVALDNLTLDIDERSFCSLLGPSGCGKTTLMRCIAGLEEPTSGEISIGGRTVFSATKGINLPPNKREIGMVFQSYAIWPHMTVFENVAFPVRTRGMADVDKRVRKALDMVGLRELESRYASRMSGGQQQRIAFARAIVAEPKLLMLDEPLSNLDAALRDTMRAELRKMQRELEVTTIYVTHDQTEALSLSDKIALMRSGRFVEIAAPEDLYDKPSTEFGALFIGGSNLLRGQISSENAIVGRFQVSTPVGVFETEDDTQTAGPVTVFIRPGKLSLAAIQEETPFASLVQAQIINRSFIGSGWEFELRSHKGAALLRSTMANGKRFEVGQDVKVFADPKDVHLLEKGAVTAGA